MTSAVKSLDRFGYPISMTYNSEKTYKSFFGGSMTIISVILLVTIFGINIEKAID